MPSVLQEAGVLVFCDSFRLVNRRPLEPGFRKLSSDSGRSLLKNLDSQTLPGTPPSEGKSTAPAPWFPFSKSEYWQYEILSHDLQEADPARPYPSFSAFFSLFLHDIRPPVIEFRPQNLLSGRQFSYLAVPPL